MCAYIFMFLHCFGHHLNVCLDENKHTGRHLPTLFRLLSFTRVRLHQNVSFFFVGAFIKMFAFTRVHFHQNVCFDSCAPTSSVCLHSCAPKSKYLLSLYALSSKLFLLLVSTYIKSLLFLCAFLKTFPFTRVRLHQFCIFTCLRQNVSFYSCAPTVHQKCAFLCALSSKRFALLVCAYIKC